MSYEFSENNSINQPEEKDMPRYLYKVLSLENWEKSQSENFIILTNEDKDFIHLATAEQLPRILEKYGSDKSVILKILVDRLTGKLILETNPGGSNKYYHLYEGSIPLNAIAEVKNR